MLEFLILSLATFRIAYFLVEESGPWHVAEKLRELAGLRANENGWTDPNGGFWAQLLSCIYCTSVWVALLLTLLYLVSSGIAFMVALPFAFSTVAILLYEAKAWLEQAR